MDDDDVSVSIKIWVRTA